MKTCVTCKWYFFNEKHPNHDRCMCPILPANDNVNKLQTLVGREQSLETTHCNFARESVRQCGKEGALWEAKECEAKTE